MENGNELKIDATMSIGKALMMLSDYDNLILELELEKLRNEDLRERLVIASSKLIEIKNLIYQEVDPDKITEIIKR